MATGAIETDHLDDIGAVHQEGDRLQGNESNIL